MQHYLCNKQMTGKASLRLITPQHLLRGVSFHMARFSQEGLAVFLVWVYNLIFSVSDPISIQIPLPFGQNPAYFLQTEEKQFSKPKK